MINWKEVGNLHVISKLKKILDKWYGTELIYIDKSGKVMSDHLNKDYQFKNHFLKVILQMDYGHNYLSEDMEKICEIIESKQKNSIIFDSIFPNVKAIASGIFIEGEFLGAAVAFPFVLDSITTKEASEIKNKMSKFGARENDITPAISHMKKMSLKDLENFRELVELVSEEIITFHQEITKREDRIHELNSELGDKYRYHSMVGKSNKMQKIYRLLEKVSKSSSSILIQGENGTGKELAAKAIHFFSPRSENVFLAVNCSAFNDNLLDSELFGHTKGAFTGAIKDKKGLFEQAHGGTLFLDEIGDTSLSMQVKLLRVLQEGTYLPVGAVMPKKCDVRIICATNRNLKEMMENGEFREDLFYRINVINIKVPSLRDRREDIPLLVDHFLSKKCAELGLPPKIVSKLCLEKVLDYSWPGNVRELENEIERLVVLAGDDKTITPNLLSPRIANYGNSTSIISRGINTTGNLKKALEELESLMIREGLKRCNFNKSKLSKELGISRASLIMKVDKYDLDKRKKASNE